MALLAGCSDGAQWRSVQPPGWQLEAQMPCKPDRHVRSLQLAGRTLEWTLLECAVHGHQFALGSAVLPEPAAVPAVLQALGQRPAPGNGLRVLEERAAGVPGMTPQPQARQWRVAAALPDGRQTQQQAVAFAHGMRVVQATVVGPDLPAALTQPFFDGLRVRP